MRVLSRLRPAHSARLVSTELSRCWVWIDRIEVASGHLAGFARFAADSRTPNARMSHRPFRSDYSGPAMQTVAVPPQPSLREQLNGPRSRPGPMDRTYAITASAGTEFRRHAVAWGLKPIMVSMAFASKAPAPCIAPQSMLASD